MKDDADVEASGSRSCYGGGLGDDCEQYGWQDALRVGEREVK